MYSTDEIKFKTTDSAKFEIIEKFKNLVKNGISGLPAVRDMIEIDGVRIRFDDGWALVRASNTTPIIVTRFEAKSPEFRDEMQRVIMGALEEIAK